MAHPSVVINGVTYQNCPEVDIPKSGSGTAKFYDASEADAVAGNVLTGKVFIQKRILYHGIKTDKKSGKEYYSPWILFLIPTHLLQNLVCSLFPVMYIFILSAILYFHSVSKICLIIFYPKIFSETDFDLLFNFSVSPRTPRLQ